MPSSQPPRSAVRAIDVYSLADVGMVQTSSSVSATLKFAFIVHASHRVLCRQRCTPYMCPLVHICCHCLIFVRRLHVCT